jgi:lipoic acid synthetase
VGEVAAYLRKHGLHTVCSGAKCPNVAECWGCGTATFMILGAACTRDCRFCAVPHDPAPGPPSDGEPSAVAETAAGLALRYVVVTSVTRDDLPDGGAAQFGAVVAAVRDRLAEARVELLVPDFLGDPAALDRVVAARPDVVGHNLETTRRLTPLVRDRRCRFERSLAVLRHFAEAGLPTKTALLLGLGESEEEILETLAEARRAGVSHLAMGQYLAPGPRHAPVQRYWSPEEFERLGQAARGMGFSAVASAPLVRSSYRADASSPIPTRRPDPGQV